MTLKSFFAVAALIATILGWTPFAKADVIYSVSGVFDDGATLSGKFSVNTYGDVIYTSLDLITTTGTSAVSNYTYTSATSFPDGGCSASNCITYGRLVPPYFGAIELAFQNPLGSVAVDPIVVGANSWENLSYTLGDAPIRYLTSGSVS